jgi:hypothetical protein
MIAAMGQANAPERKASPPKIRLGIDGWFFGGTSNKGLRTTTANLEP